MSGDDEKKYPQTGFLRALQKFCCERNFEFVYFVFEFKTKKHA
jgi:hypothetical protein